ncbi:MBL fold metallo-hydrolase [Amycolatopsis rhabdoformis]|uniref:MBL fold metallo-hydrolase n=1 Tax=Amycolatopsis rhabdoformis TaxID=1448059 RepID=A0ABZ1ICC8_9PSEU|nr:MBL fold metallo-hydrolase [Amycolatopsis rhabdoformis]WSE32100.1 MBL fold metallo-hydrolase [Amycolatopsis rhabdoformis]
MCEAHHVIGRRGLLRGSALLGGAGLAAMVGGCTTAAPATGGGAQPSAAKGPVPSTGTHLVLLGTQGGPIPGKRAAVSSALVVDGSIYVIDAGSGLTLRFSEAGLDFKKVRAMFVTHLHSDHVADYFNFFSLNWTNWDFGKQTVEVHGPGRASANGPAGSPVPGLPITPTAPLVTPGLATPGITDITDLSVRANAYDLNERLRSTRRQGDHALEFTGLSGPPMMRPHDIAVPAAASIDVLAPKIAPIPVYRDDKVEVTATLVDHPPVFPAFAFHFRTPHATVVFSGDTTPCQNLFDLASGADVLVNEVMAVEAAVAKFDGTPIHDTMEIQFTSAHTPLHSRPAAQGRPAVPGVGAVARTVNAKALVLTHIYPGDGTVSDAEFRSSVAADYRGPVVVGNDLMTLDLAALAKH